MDQDKPQTGQPVETYESLAHLLEYELLRPDLSPDDVAGNCRIARDYRIAAVAVRPCDAEQAVRSMKGSSTAVASTSGYPDGTSTTAAKLYEGRDLLRLGVKEIDFVLNPARMIGRQFQHVEIELQQMAESCHQAGAILKVVMKNPYLADDLKIIGTKICKRIEADILSIEAVTADLDLIRPLLKDVLRLKRATPVSTLEEALEARSAGFARIATSDPIPVLNAWKERLASRAAGAPVES
jgi:deoxyribose-phosphate aldolase